MFDGVDGTKCPHDELFEKPDVSGWWCKRCGLKIIAVERRPCNDCRHAIDKKENQFVCKKKSRHIDCDPRKYFVTYRVKNRTCWDEKPKPVKKAMLKAGIARLRKINKNLSK
jgi:hypothetical protein